MSEEQTPRTPAPDGGGEQEEEQVRLLVTRREFLIGAGAGVAVTAAAAGAVSVLSPPAPQPAPPTTAPAPVPGAPAAEPGAPAVAPSELPASMRRVSINIDGRPHDVIVDVRESLWETMTYKLGMASSNLGCDRAQCGACAVVVDGRAVNGCTVLSARLGRGQNILTVDGIRTGPGVAGLHPIQRAFWEEGGFQCGICTRGFIMSAWELLQKTTSPTDEQIQEALAGNICRCSEYPKMYDSVARAAAELRGATA